MSTQLMLSENFHFITGIDPVADVFNGTVYTDVVNVKNALSVVFVVHLGVTSTGTATLTVQACDDTTPSNRTAIPFRYRKNVDTTASDVFGALTAATSTGFATTAGTSTHGQMYIIEVDAANLASTGYKYIQLKALEVVNDPVLGGVLIGLRLAYPRSITTTQIT